MSTHSQDNMGSTYPAIANLELMLIDKAIALPFRVGCPVASSCDRSDWLI
ncbi:MAG: hypothetical protein HC839_05555, partial [Leptolyngbyaceae cyanobacterium RM2_2_21]|nr:hypothetical protein [Leptolyngbyaceae cyanobacterium RM2_2_21]